MSYQLKEPHDFVAIQWGSIPAAVAWLDEQGADVFDVRDSGSNWIVHVEDAPSGVAAIVTRPDHIRILHRVNGEFSHEAVTTLGGWIVKDRRKVEGLQARFIAMTDARFRSMFDQKEEKG